MHNIYTRLYRDHNGEWKRRILLASFYLRADADLYLDSLRRKQADWPVEKRWPVEVVYS